MKSWDIGRGNFFREEGDEIHLANLLLENTRNVFDVNLFAADVFVDQPVMAEVDQRGWLEIHFFRSLDGVLQCGCTHSGISKNIFVCDAKEDSEILGVPNDEMQIHLMLVILLMAEILHQLIGSLSHYL